jgi:ethanolamine utilization protein EutA
MLDVLARKQSIASLEPLIHSTPCQVLPVIDEVMVSGGVGRLTLEASPTTMAEAAKYNDIGPILAAELVKALKSYSFTVVKAVQTSNATVIGAGMQTTTLSGATISILISANR